MHLLYEIEHLSTSGGIERILTDKVNYIVEEWGWQVTIVVLLEEEPSTAYSMSPKVNIRYLHIKSKGIRMCAEALWKLNRIVTELKPDVYVTFQTIGAMSCLLRTHHIPTIYEAHGIRTCMQHPMAMSIAEKYADCVVTLTAKNAERYCKAKRVEVIPNFTSFSTAHPADYGQKHCVTLGRLDYEKNYSRLIDIWRAVHPQHPEWVLDIYGEGPEYEALQQKIESLGLSSSVILHGVTHIPTESYQKASIFLMTSLFEGLPMVLLEASACGLPSIAFDCDDGPRDIIQDGKTGYLIPYEDDQMYIAKLSALMDDEALRQDMGKAARVSSQRFLPAPIMAQWQKLFTEINS